MTPVWRRGLLAVVSAFGLAAPAVAQTGGFGQPTLLIGRQGSLSGGQSAAMPQLGPNGMTTQSVQGQAAGTSTGTDDPWSEVLALADKLATDLNIDFQEPWEEALFMMLVVRLWVELKMMGVDLSGLTDGSTGSPGGTTSGTVGGISTAGVGTGSGGFGGGSLVIGGRR